MQLEERGKLRLYDPVNRHLPDDLRIPGEGWKKPIRILDLMNHTAGFEDVNQGVDQTDDAQLLTLRQDLRRYRPLRVREPGELSVYSNYGAQLAGAIVAHVSGVDFETYIEQQVLGPLGMNHTTFREPYGPTAPRGLPAPMPSSLVPDRAMSIEWRNGAWQSFPRQHILSAVSAGAASSTASDMTRYMLALLEPAVLERAGVLKASTFAQMTQESFRPAEGLRGIHHGLFDTPPGARSVLGYANLSHSGFVDHFASHMLLFPELGLGTFVATNSSVGAKLASALHELILRRYFARPAQQLSAAGSEPDDLRECAGDYRPMRRNYTQLEAVFSLDAIIRLDAAGSGTLILHERADDTSRYIRIGRDLFQKADGDARLAFLRGPNGEIARVVGAVNADRVHFFQTALWLRGWLFLSLVVSGATLWRGRRRRRAAAGSTSNYAVAPAPSVRAPAARAEQAVQLSASIWVAVYVASATWQVRYGFGDALQNYPQPVLKLVLVLLMAAAVSTMLAVLMLPAVWLKSGWTLARRVRHTLVLLVLTMAIVALKQWNALGLHYF
jgi:CubicO group peptidase (beta-lactamase class C family)